MTRNLGLTAGWVLVLGLVWALTGCCGLDDEALDEPSTYEEGAPDEEDDDEEGYDEDDDAPSKGEASGRVQVKFKKPRAKKLKKLAKVLKREATFKKLAADLEKRLRLPGDLPIVFEECGVANAFYDPEERRVSMCYELVEHFHRGFEDIYDDPDEVMDAALGATFHTYLHEVGHALVDMLKLPITGREEDAVDQLATYVLLDYGEEGEQMAIDGAEAFVLDEDEDPVFWGEHALGVQRFYSILCLIYGKDPDKNDDLVNGDYLPEERAERCPEEYAQLKRIWLTLLEPHRR